MGESLRVLNAKYRSSLESPFHVHPYYRQSRPTYHVICKFKSYKTTLILPIKIHSHKTTKHIQTSKGCEI